MTKHQEARLRSRFRTSRRNHSRRFDLLVGDVSKRGRCGLNRGAGNVFTAMKLIVEMFRRVWQRSRTDGDAFAAHAGDGGDRSSMADFVRILQMHDRDRGSSSQA